jgi:hypothetical protein
VRHFFAIFFAALAVILAIVAISSNRKQGDGADFAAPRNVVPVTETAIDLGQVNAIIAGTGAGPISLLPLREGENLLQTLSTDFDGDGYDDQINAVRRNGGPIILLVGIYDPRASQYRRVDEIDTGIVHEQSFSYSCMDMTGEHRNALVYSGLAANGDYVMQIYLVSGRAPSVTLAIIGNFRTNGTIFVQQVDRYDVYESGRMTGASYPVWVYGQDSGLPGSLDTVQTMYDWSASAGRYVMVSQRRVTEQRQISTELARIQAGGMDSIGAYLEGVWNLSSSNDDTRRDLYFNYVDKEISFVYDDIQEVYRWERSVVRRNGVYITAVNAAIANLQRQIDLNLTGLGELSLRIQDDVRLNISATSLWDGSYQKVTEPAKPQALFASFSQTLLEKPAWTAPDGTVLHFGPAHGALTLDSPSGGALRGLIPTVQRGRYFYDRYFFPQYSL